MPNSDPPPKSWWSLSKASSARDARRTYSDAKLYNRHSSNAKPLSGFKSIAEAIGFRSKKVRPSTSQFENSPANGYSHSPVATKTLKSPLLNSPTESMELLTPIDTRRLGGHSLLTLGDDPFTVRPLVVQVRQSPVPSAYSNASATDLLSKETDSPVYRTSYASSSTNSHSHGLDTSSTVVSSSPRGLPESKKVRLKRSVGSMQVTMPDHPSRQAFTPNSNPTGNDALPPHQKLRSRGMTDGGLPQKAGFFVKEPMIFRKLSTTPDVLSETTTTPESIPKLRKGRQASTRIHAPPTAPPTSSLPATPPVEQPDPRQRVGLDPLPASSPPSSTPIVNDYPTTIQDAKQTSQPDLRSPEESIPESVEHSIQDSKTLPSSPRTLKKASSQRSLIRGTSPASSVRTISCPEQSSDKRTQRNYHSRLPLPTLPLSIRTSFSSTPPQPFTRDPTSPSSTTEVKKFRKRLFSNSSQRPSTSTSIPISPREDDSLSVFSVRSDNDTNLASYKPLAVTRQAPSSFWDECADTTPSSPAASHADYYPQAIMSRDQLAKLEASVTGLAESPQTHESSISPSIAAAEVEELQEQPDSVVLSPTPSLQSERKSVQTSSVTLASLQSQSGSPRRPVTADPLMRVSKEREGSAAEPALSTDANSTSTIPPLDSTTGLTSLPPPPRPRLRSTNSIRSTTSVATTITSSVGQLNSSKVRLERPNTAITTTSPLQPGAPGTGNLRPPLLSFSKSAGAQTRGKARPSGVLEKTIHRRSIMRKSSFLDIDGEADPELEVKEKRDSLFVAIKASAGSVSSNGSIGGSKTGESFLDFARESFDTIRT